MNWGDFLVWLERGRDSLHTKYRIITPVWEHGELYGPLVGGIVNGDPGRVAGQRRSQVRIRHAGIVTAHVGQLQGAHPHTHVCKIKNNTILHGPASWFLLQECELLSPYSLSNAANLFCFPSSLPLLTLVMHHGSVWVYLPSLFSFLTLFLRYGLA